MGCKELIESLRHSADERIQSVGQEAESEAEKIKSEVSAKIAGIRERYAGIHSSEVREKTVQIFSEANNRARLVRLDAEKALAERLFSLALSLLPELRKEEYRTVFMALARELPPLPWKTVRVNPGDADLARECFPDAEIVPDRKITAGMDATTESGKVRANNTFEKRLQRAWEEMLPRIIRDIYEEVSNHGTPPMA
jgi:vacuolar-type H+-ATPase subunit E/Vma4